ncbi:MAG TPA: hypothetical protein VLH09_02240 [Bryobacteraceae bacterium]|nr:hypothetical protein [Bryobacteraceae bacterium]
MNAAFPFKRDVAGRLLESPDTRATVLHVILLAAYGQDIYTTDPLALYRQLEEDFGIRLPVEAENRINALFLALTTDAFYLDAEAFSAVASALYGGDIGDDAEDMFDALTVPEICWALYEVKLNREEEDELAPPVLALVTETLQRETAGSESVDNFLEEMKVDLHTQLAELGVPAEDLHYYLA